MKLKRSISLLVALCMLLSCAPALAGMVSAEEMPVSERTVESISVEPLTLIENTDGSYEGHWDETTGEYIDHTWFSYDIVPEMMTVNFKDGSTITGTVHEVQEAVGSYADFETDQSHENPWGVGTHTGIATLMGVSTEYTVEIIPSPVESISVEPLALIEKAHGHSELYWDEATGDWVKDAWFCYSIEPKTVTIRYQDGSTFTGTPEEIYDQTGYHVDSDSDQSYEKPWGVGTHTATATFMGVSAEYTVVISETPVESISVEPLTLIENVDGYHEGYWDDATGDYAENTWFRYFINPETVTIRYKDGKVVTGDLYKIYDEATAYGVNFEYASDQSEENPWGVGTHTATATFMGVSTEYTVEITENPIEKVEIVKAPDKSVFFTGEYIDLKGAALRISYKDGTYEDLPFTWPTVGSNLYYRFHNQRLNKDFTVDLSDYTFAKPGTHKVGVNILNMTCAFDVTVVDSTVEAITIRSDSEDSLIITAKQSDGTSFDMHVLAMEIWDQSETEVGTVEYGTLLTDRGCFTAAFHYPKDGGVYVQVGIGPDVDMLQSNTLERCDWTDFNKCTQVYATLVYSLSRVTNAYDGVVTQGNIDDLIAIAFGVNMYSDTPVEYTEQDGKIVIQGAAVKECLQQLFELTDVDLSLTKNYDPKTDEYLLALDDIIAGSCILPIASSRNNGVIDIQATMVDGGSVHILVNEKNDKIQSFDLSKPGAVKPVEPVTPPTGGSRLVLPAILLLASAMLLCAIAFKRRSSVR